ncbi:DNA-processing protein DprA [Tissierella simiarum]
MGEITQKEVLIWLNSLNIGNSNIEKIMEYFIDLRDLWISPAKEINSIKSIKNEIKEKIINNRNSDYIKRLFSDINKHNIDVITIYDENYPEGLRYIYDNPKVLYKKGSLIEEDNLAIAIVGSRKATSYGKWACEKFAKELASIGVTIVSGLALGIDAIAHKSTIEENGRTIGVLGNGLDTIYPKKNLFLYNEIETKGAILTEFPLGVPPLAFNFPLRNRIISGLSLGIIVIEAKEKSGSLITAHHALEQGKDVFALPGNINSIFSRGTNKLIKDGAKPLLDIDDILEEVYQLREKVLIKKKKKINHTNFSDTENKILKCLEEGPIHSDNIVYKTGLDISTVNSILTILELKGVIKELTGRVFTLY